MAERIGNSWVDEKRCGKCGYLQCCCVISGGGLTYNSEDLSELNAGGGSLSEAENKIRELLATGEYVVEVHIITTGDGSSTVYTIGANYEHDFDWRPCVHYDPEIGCKIYENRPALCREFKPGDGDEGCDIDGEVRYAIYNSWLPYQEILKNLYDAQEPRADRNSNTVFSLS
ncbi:YkgJ family cysteine cluster protein [Candidatus Saccharibacteria bacterium]|nr:YkgJ family cysteine cluster protein [Candidatus Saccharibacteria bacterium]